MESSLSEIKSETGNGDRQRSPRRDDANSGSAVEGQDVWTYRRILDWTQQKLREHGSESPRVEAEVLLAHAAKCQRILLYTRLDEATPDNVRATMRDLVQRRMKSEPVAYLVGHREFFSLDFRVNSSVLVPRPETETLVMAALDRLADGQPKLVLEVGVGSGCVSIAIAKTRAQVRVTAVDVSTAAIEIAKENVSRHQLNERVRVLEGPCYSAVAGSKFDLIVSNPPYIRIDEMSTLQKDVRLHEPAQALVAGEDGLDVVRELVASGRDHLNPGGSICLEIDPAQMVATSNLFEAAHWGTIRILRDANGDERVICAARD